MRKRMSVLMIVLMAAMSQAADLEALRIDFGNQSSPVQSGYQAYRATDKNLASFTLQSYSVFGTTVGIMPTFAPDAVNNVARANNRGAQAYEDATEPLMQDNIGMDRGDLGTNFRGNPMTLTISNLPAGEYSWLSYHHDTGSGATQGLFDVRVTDATGTETRTPSEGIRCSNNTATTFDAVSKFETTITSNGVDPVAIVFDLRAYPSGGRYNQAYFQINGFELTQLKRRGGATDPVPSNGSTVDSTTTSAVSWSTPLTRSELDGDPNLISVEKSDLYYYIVDTAQIAADDPNWFTKGTYVPNATSPYPVLLDYDQTMFWRVDTYVVWDSNEITGTALTTQTVEGFSWAFNTYPDNLPPIVTGSNVLTATQLLPATLKAIVDDRGEDDIESVSWTAESFVSPDAMQMITREEPLTEVTDEPSLLMDWIGTDTREGGPLFLTLKGLPAGTYNWKSYHHDARSQGGVFDVTVHDASGSAATTGIEFRFGNSLPIVTLPLTITSNGTDDVVLVFDLQSGSGTWFLMNGFELTDDASVDPLFIDFGTVVSADDATPVNVMDGYEAYTARHEVRETFTEQSFSAFGTTVSILPQWNSTAEVTIVDTTNDPSSATQTAVMTVTPPTPGTYIVTVTATDKGLSASGEKLSGTATMTVTVVADTCAAAQQSASWTGFGAVDFNRDCIVDLNDFAEFASEWLDDRKLTAQE